MATTYPAIGEAGTRNNGRHLGLALLVIATAQLMVVLDATIVNVALPHIQTALGESPHSSTACPPPRPVRTGRRTGATPRW